MKLYTSILIALVLVSCAAPIKRPKHFKPETRTETRERIRELNRPKLMYNYMEDKYEYVR